MRLCLVICVGLVTTACGLSMNPDLPSAKEGGGGPFAGQDDEGPGFDDGDIAVGDGDGLTGAPPDSEGMGGSNQTCLAMGGAGGRANCEDAQ